MIIGSRMVHTAIILVAGTRALAYSHVLGGPHDGAGPQLLSDHGEWLWAYVLGWCVCVMLSMFSLVAGRWSAAILAFVFMCVAWAGGYLTAFWISGFTSADWMTATLYAGIAIFAAGAHRSLELLEREHLQAVATRAITRIEESG